jgi:Tol biopolymer transport system component
VADGSTLRLAPVQGTKAPVWAPDGTRIAILAEDGLYVLDGVDGGGSVRRIAAIQSPRRISAPAWSPDGRRLAWVADASSRAVLRAPHADLWVTSLTDAPVRIRQGPCCLAEGFPPLGVAWSPDGRKLAMHAPGETLTRKLQGVLLVDASSGRFRRIPGGFAAWPAWQPSG